MPNRFRSGHVALAVLLAGPLGVAQPQAQEPAADVEDPGCLTDYLTHGQLADEIRRLAADHSSACTVEVIGTSREGRDIHGLRLALPGEVEPDRRPALLLVANIDGDHLVGSTVAVAVARALLAKVQADDDAVRTFLSEHTMYVVPRVNPDAAERFFSGIMSERRRTMRPDDRDLLQFGDVYVPYHEFNHPTLGEILIGGTKKYSSRVTPPWMLEEGCHRNFAFTMFHADEMPAVEWGELRVKRLGSLWEITIEVKNDKIIPTILSHARQKKIGARDLITCTPGRRAEVVASGTVSSLLPTAKLDAVERDPQRIFNDRGIPGRGSRLYRFIVSGTGSVNVEYRSQKGGTISKKVPLRKRN